MIADQSVGSRTRNDLLINGERNLAGMRYRLLRACLRYNGAKHLLRELCGTLHNIFRY